MLRLERSIYKVKNKVKKWLDRNHKIIIKWPEQNLDKKERSIENQGILKSNEEKWITKKERNREKKCCYKSETLNDLVQKILLDGAIEKKSIDIRVGRAINLNYTEHQ